MQSVNGLSRLLPNLTKEVVLSCGTTLVFSKITIGDLGEKEQFIVSKRQSLNLGFDLPSILPLLKANSKELVNAVLEAIKECVVAALERPQFATNQEVQTFDLSATGQAFDLLLTLRKTSSNKIENLDDAQMLYQTLLRRPQDFNLVFHTVAEFSYDCLQPKN